MYVGCVRCKLVGKSHTREHEHPGVPQKRAGLQVFSRGRFGGLFPERRDCVAVPDFPPTFDIAVPRRGRVRLYAECDNIAFVRNSDSATDVMYERGNRCYDMVRRHDEKGLQVFMLSQVADRAGYGRSGIAGTGFSDYGQLSAYGFR